LWWAAALLGVPLLAIAFNPIPAASVDPAIVRRMPGVPAVIGDTRHPTPGPLLTSQRSVGEYPLATCLLWVETAVGRRCGFFWTACGGLALFVAAGWLTVALAWRFTGSRWCALIAAVLAPSVRFFNAGGRQQPADWLAWYPIHPNLLLIVWLLGALLAWCVWLDTNRKPALIMTWACFLGGALTSIFAAVFPFMALVLVGGRQRQVATRTALSQAGGMLVIAALSLVLGQHPQVPVFDDQWPTAALQIARKPLLFWFGSFDRYLFVHAYWMVGLALLVFAYFGAFLHWRSRFGSRLAVAQGWAVACGLFLLILCLYLIVPGWLPDIMGNFMNWRDTEYFLFDLAAMVLTLYSISLLWKYRRDEPSLAAWLLMALAYIPIFTFEDWHYTIAGWFLRSAIYWPLVVKLAYRDAARAGH
jgi:hypothetical protein